MKRVPEERTATREHLARLERHRARNWDYTPPSPEALLADSHRFRTIERENPKWIAMAIEFRRAHYRWRATGSTRVVEQPR